MVTAPVACSSEEEMTSTGAVLVNAVTSFRAVPKTTTSSSPSAAALGSAELISAAWSEKFAVPLNSAAIADRIGFRMSLLNS